MTTIHLFVLEMDYRPKNPNKPQYRCWAQTAKEAREFMEDKFTWLNTYSMRYATKEEYERFAKDDITIRMYTHNFVQYYHILKARGFVCSKD